MEIKINQVKPGMILQSDIVGQTGRPIIKKNTHLNELHIRFMRKFLVKTIEIAPLSNEVVTELNLTNKKDVRVIEVKESAFDKQYRTAVTSFKDKFYEWKREVPITMIDINLISLSLLKEARKQRLETIVGLMDECTPNNVFFEHVIASSVLSVYLSKCLGFEKKEQIQIGYASILRDSGLIHFDDKYIIGERLTAAEKERYELHPVYSYKLVDLLKTLTQAAKVGILQHHENLDGTGFPGKASGDKIHPYARIIRVSDFFYTQLYEKKDLQAVINLLEENSNKYFDREVVNELVINLKKVE